MSPAVLHTPPGHRGPHRPQHPPVAAAAGAGADGLTLRAVVIAALRARTTRPGGDVDVFGVDATTLDDDALWRHLRWTAADHAAQDVGLLIAGIVWNLDPSPFSDEIGWPGPALREPDFTLARRTVADLRTAFAGRGWCRAGELPDTVTALGESIADHATLPAPAEHCMFGLACSQGLWILPGQPLYDHGPDGSDPVHAACVRRRAAEVLAGLAAPAATGPAARPGPGEVCGGPVGVVLDVVAELVAEAARQGRHDRGGRPHPSREEINARLQSRLQGAPQLAGAVA